MKVPTNVSEDFRKLNPHLYGSPVGKVETGQSKPAQIPALDRDKPKREPRKTGVVFRVGFITCRRRLLDSDNAVASLKEVRDAVATSLGLDDGDPRIAWEYHQVKTSGEEGVLVKIDRYRVPASS